MHGRGVSEDEPMAEMNMIPLIDIALTLVIILMVTTVFIKNPGVSLKLPETATREGAPETSKDIVVTLTAKGDLFLDGQKTDAARLMTRLQSTAAADKQARVLVKGDRDVAYARVMDVMDMARQAGLTRVVLPTDPKASVTPVPAADAPTKAQ